MNSVKHRAASDWNATIKHINTTDIDRRDLLKSLKECIFESYTEFKNGFSHTHNSISKLKLVNGLQDVFFPYFLLNC